MTPDSSGLEQLGVLSEAEFRSSVLMPLLRRMGMQNVTERHGPDEYGKDITFLEDSQIRGQYYAVVAKIGDVSGAASGKQNLAIVREQAKQAFKVPFVDVTQKDRRFVDRVIVWITGKFSNNAAEIILYDTGETRDVLFWDGQRTIGLLEKYWPAYFAISDPTVSDYYDVVKIHYGTIEELRTLGSASDTKRLPSMFVPPRFSRQIRLGGKTTKEYLRYEDFCALKRNVLLVGQAGAGKTTLLRKMLLDIISENENSHSAEPIPVLISARDIELGGSCAVEAAICREFQKYAPSVDLSEKYGYDLATGGFCILVDGLDEAEGLDHVEQVASVIRSFAMSHANAHVVVSSRMMAVLKRPTMFAGFDQYELEELDQRQVKSFIANWFGPASEQTLRLFSRLGNRQGLAGLPVTPLTLALLVILQESTHYKEIPANQTELFSKYIELVLGRWDISRDISLQFEYKTKTHFLQRISWYMHENNAGAMSDDEFCTWVDMLNEEIGLHLDAETLKFEVLDRSELLFRNPEGDYEFKHRAFLDYFVGSELNRQADACEIVRANFLDPRWSQAIRFAAGLHPDKEEYLLAVLNGVSPADELKALFANELGALTQAVFMAKKSTKIRSVQRILDNLLEFWDFICVIYETVEEPRHGLSPQLAWLLLHAYIAKQSLGSITLSGPLSDEAEAFLRSLATNHRVSLRDEWRAFLLATACAECDDTVPTFLKLLDSRVFRDPALLVVATLDCRAIEARSWLPADTRNVAKEARKQLLARVRLAAGRSTAAAWLKPIPLLETDDP